jgi:hypothetical protein
MNATLIMCDKEKRMKFCDVPHEDLSGQDWSLLIDTPLGQRSWGDVFKALCRYDRMRQLAKEKSERASLASKKGWETRRRK